MAIAIQFCENCCYRYKILLHSYFKLAISLRCIFSTFIAFIMLYIVWKRANKRGKKSFLPYIYLFKRTMLYTLNLGILFSSKKNIYHMRLVIWLFSLLYNTKTKTTKVPMNKLAIFHIILFVFSHISNRDPCKYSDCINSRILFMWIPNKHSKKKIRANISKTENPQKSNTQPTHKKTLSTFFLDTPNIT